MEQQGRIVPASNRYRAGEASIRSSEEQDRSRHHSAHRGGLELSTGTGMYGVCRSTQCCLAVWSIWVESSTRLGGFKALKKTTEAPYTNQSELLQVHQPWNHPPQDTTDILRIPRYPQDTAVSPGYTRVSWDTVSPEDTAPCPGDMPVSGVLRSGCPPCACPRTPTRVFADARASHLDDDVRACSPPSRPSAHSAHRDRRQGQSPLRVMA